MVTMIVLGGVNRRGAHGGRGKANAMITKYRYCQELSFGGSAEGRTTIIQHDSSTRTQTRVLVKRNQFSLNTLYSTVIVAN